MLCATRSSSYLVAEPMIEAETITARNLAHLLDRREVTLLDVGLVEDFEIERIAGAQSNCVFEIEFMDRARDLVPDQGAPVCVYGAAGDSHESRVAAEKLRRGGYRHVLEFRDGIQGWKADRRPTEGRGTSSPPPIIGDGEHQIDVGQSRLEWLGRNLLSKHFGEIGLRNGLLRIQGGRIVSGRLSIDMTDIRCADLHGDALHDILVTHLQSDDFFDVTRFPKAVFELASATPIASAGPGAPNHRVVGNLTLRGVTAPVEFAMTAGITPAGKAAAQGSFSIDRTRWGVIYGSGKFFRRLAGHLVNDEIEIQFRMITE